MDIPGYRDDTVAELLAGLRSMAPAADDSARVARLRALEELKSAAAAAQAAETAAFVRSQRQAQAAAGVKAERVGRGIASQVGLALRVSPHRAQRYVGWSMILTSELPETFAALARGETTEWRAQLVARETIFLSREHRAEVDAALGRAADATTAVGDERGRGQIMADRLVERITGQSAAPEVPVEINLVMTDQTLLGGDDEPAVLDGYGPVPAGIARDLITRASASTPMWLRRLFRSPRTGELVSMESRRRAFTPAQRHYLTILDDVCTTPWCGAPIRHVDHAEPVSDGGTTDLRNGRGTCATCNYAKQAPGWHTTIRTRGLGREIIIRTPTGHFYRHRAPDPPGAPPISRAERRFAELIYDAQPRAA